MRKGLLKRSLIVLLICILATPTPVFATADGVTEVDYIDETNMDFNEVFDVVADANTLTNTTNQNDTLGFLQNIELKIGAKDLAGYKARRGYLKFDLTTVNRPVKKATLLLHGRNITDSKTVTLGAYQITDDSWQEATICGANAPEMLDLINSVDMNSTAKYYDIDVTDYVQAQLEGDKIVSIGLNPTRDVPDKGININSKEGGAYPPKLLLDYASAPTIDTVLTAPAAKSYNLTGKDITFTGSATDLNGKAITSIEIYANDNLFSTQEGASFNFKDKTLAPGKYEIYTKAINEDGEFAYSEKVPIVVAGIQLSNVWGDDMILQRNKPMVFRGKGIKGVGVTVEVNGISASSVVGSDSKWEVTLPPQPANKGTTLKFTTSEGVEFSFNNVAIGEVILCSGQSNMETDIYYYGNKLTGEVDKDYPDIRLFKQAKWPGVRGGRWAVANASEAYAFSAIGYLSGKYYYLSENGEVPVGLIFAAVGGTTINLWTTTTSFDYDPDTKPKKNSGHYGMVSPFTEMTIGQVLWYQGESDCYSYIPYEKLLTEYIDGYREAWKDENLNFIIVQIPLNDYERSGLNRLALHVREAQFNVSERIDNVATVITIDTGEPKNVHPADKVPVAKRIALALKHFTNPDNASFVWKSPSYSHHVQDGNTMTIYFKDYAGGLKTTDGQAPRGFKIAGDDNKFVDANVTLVNNTIVVDTTGIVGTPKVRYALEGAPTYNGEYTVVNVASSADLPLAPFRTDKEKVNCTTYNEDGTMSNPLNFAPTIRKITAGKVVNGVAQITINARDYDGYIEKLELYADSNLLGTATLADGEANYTFNWENPTLGTHTLYAIATDEMGTTSTQSHESVGTTTVNPRKYTINLVEASYSLLPFTDLSGKEITAFEGENGVCVEAILDGPSVLIIGAYEDDTLINIKIADENIAAFTSDELTGANNVRAFVFKDTNTIYPLTNAEIINRTAK